MKEKDDTQMRLKLCTSSLNCLKWTGF